MVHVCLVGAGRAIWSQFGYRMTPKSPATEKGPLGQGRYQAPSVLRDRPPSWPVRAREWGEPRAILLGLRPGALKVGRVPL